jgi:hypothetical protein
MRTKLGVAIPLERLLDIVKVFAALVTFTKGHSSLEKKQVKRKYEAASPITLRSCSVLCFVKAVNSSMHF